MKVCLKSFCYSKNDLYICCIKTLKLKIMEFKGTKGEWTKYQNGEGDIEISAKGFPNLATVNFYPMGFREKYINGKLTGSKIPDSNSFRKECLYNALLISKAPEMLEMLENMKDELCCCLQKLQQYGEEVDFQTPSEAAQLIKEATGL